MSIEHVPGAGTESDLLSVAQVARRLGCSVSLVQKWRRLGWLPATRLGPPVVPIYGYRAVDVERFASERWNRQRGRPRLAAGAAPPTPVAPARPGAPPRAGGLTWPADPMRPGQPGAARAARAADEGAPDTPNTPAPVPGGIAGATGRPLAIWAGDPREGTALVLARFPAAELETALGIAATWARRYDDLVLGEPPAAAGERPNVLARWRNGAREPV